MSHDMLHHMIDERSAVDAQRVVEARFGYQLVSLIDISQEQRAHSRFGQRNPIEIIILAAHIGSHANDVAFVRGNDTEVEFLEEASKFRKLAAPLTADFYREHDVFTICEAE